jgi:dimeric dUTPase (all-alpha-NTP-PPase superfamily)
MIASQVIEMLQLQDKFNRRVNEFWMDADYPWNRAIFIESAELLDHLGWKWWKAQTINLEQAQMELVDIWHFVLSDILVEHKGNVQAATLAIMQGWQSPHRKVSVKNSDGTHTPIAALDRFRKVELFAGLAAVSGDLLLPLLRLISEDLHMTFTDIYQMYLTKNALNHFRQIHGYKEGTYIKIWDGKEDNEVALHIVEDENVTYDQLMVRLEQVYQDVAK